MYPAEILMNGFAGLGIGPGDTVLLHSSYKQVGPVSGGPATVVDILLDLLGSGGNLLVPTLPFLGSTAAYLAGSPSFDVRNTPSRMGIITEQVRLRPAAVRSLHPTHAVAGIGPDVPELLKDHDKAPGPCDRFGSPFGRLIDAGGKIVLLGVGHHSDTTLHTCEEAAGLSYIVTEETYTVPVTDAAGTAFMVETRCHRPGYRRLFDRVDGLLDEAGLQKKGVVGNAPCRVVRSIDLFNTVMEKLRTDPWYLAEKI